MRDPTFIQNWINTVDLDKDTKTTTDFKTTGKRAYPSPEPEEMSDLTPERTKKRKTVSTDDDDEIEDVDAETTPRALLIPSRPAPSPSPSPTKSSASIRSASLRSSSQASSSRASSSRRKLSNLSLVEHGVVTPLRSRLEAQVIGTCRVLRSWLRAGIIRDLDPFFVSVAEEKDNLKMTHMTDDEL